MTKKEIVRAISDKTGLTQLQIKEIVQLTFEGIVETLLEEGRVELRNFGVFQVKTRKARQARNPRTGRQVSVPAKSVVVFKPGKGMEARVKLATNKDWQPDWSSSAKLLRMLPMTSQNSKKNQPNFSPVLDW